MFCVSIDLLFIEHCLKLPILDEEYDIQEYRHSNDQDDDDRQNTSNN